MAGPSQKRKLEELIYDTLEGTTTNSNEDRESHNIKKQKLESQTQLTRKNLSRHGRAQESTLEESVSSYLSTIEKDTIPAQAIHNPASYASPYGPASSYPAASYTTLYGSANSHPAASYSSPYGSTNSHQAASYTTPYGSTNSKNPATSYKTPYSSANSLPTASYTAPYSSANSKNLAASSTTPYTSANSKHPASKRSRYASADLKLNDSKQSGMTDLPEWMMNTNVSSLKAAVINKLPLQQYGKGGLVAVTEEEMEFVDWSKLGKTKLSLSKNCGCHRKMYYDSKENDPFGITASRWGDLGLGEERAKVCAHCTVGNRLEQVFEHIARY